MIFDEPGFEEYRIENDCAVYLLVNGEEIVYIGKSTQLGSRLRHHINKGINHVMFDKIYVRYCTSAELSGLEERLIKTYKPRANFRDNPRYGYPEHVALPVTVDLEALGLKPTQWRVDTSRRSGPHGPPRGR